jgi:hypothetical protein
MNDVMAWIARPDNTAALLDGLLLAIAQAGAYLQESGYLQNRKL